MNKVILLGYLTKDITLKYAQSGMAVGTTSIAINRKWKDKNGEQKEEVCFIDITFFGRSAEIANQYLKKGSKVLVEGRIVFEQWSDQNGYKKSKHSIVVESMQMLDCKDGANSTQPQQPKQQEQPRQTQPPQPKQQEMEMVDIADEDIPF